MYTHTVDVWASHQLLTFELEVLLCADFISQVARPFLLEDSTGLACMALFQHEAIATDQSSRTCHWTTLSSSFPRRVLPKILLYKGSTETPSHSDTKHCLRGFVPRPHCDGFPTQPAQATRTVATTGTSQSTFHSAARVHHFLLCLQKEISFDIGTCTCTNLTWCGLSSYLVYCSPETLLGPRGHSFQERGVRLLGGARCQNLQIE